MEALVRASSPPDLENLMKINSSCHRIRLLVTQRPYAQNPRVQDLLRQEMQETIGPGEIRSAAGRGKGPYWIEIQDASLATRLREMSFNSKITQVVTSVRRDQWASLPSTLLQWTASNPIPQPVAIDSVALRRSPSFSTQVAKDRIRERLKDLTFARAEAQGPRTYISIIQDAHTIHIGVTSTGIHLPRQAINKACFRELIFVYVDPDSHWDLVDVVRMAEIFGFRLHIINGQATIRRAINQAPRAFRDALITTSNQIRSPEIANRRRIALDRAGDPGFWNEDLSTLSGSAVIVGNRKGLDPRILIQSERVYRFGPQTTQSLTSSQAIACALGTIEARQLSPR